MHHMCRATPLLGHMCAHFIFGMTGGTDQHQYLQVPPPSQRVLPWEQELEDGTIVSTIKEDSSGEGVLSLTIGTVGRLMLRAVTGVAKKTGLL